MPLHPATEGQSVMAKKKDTGFAVRLRELREAAGLTQSQLADRAGMHLHGITKLEQGDRAPAWATVLALAEALEVGCEAFVDSKAGGRASSAGGEEESPSSGRPRGRPKKPAAPPPPAEKLEAQAEARKPVPKKPGGRRPKGGTRKGGGVR